MVVKIILYFLSILEATKYYLIKGVLICLFIIFLLHKLSLSEKTNLFPFITMLVKRIFKYETIFSCISGNYLFQERPYTTSAIKNFLFKKHGGDKKAVVHNEFFFI